jgi:hypothetical protein
MPVTSLTASAGLVVGMEALAVAEPRRPHPSCARKAVPVDLRYAPTVSRRTLVACSMRRSVQPNRSTAYNLSLLFFTQRGTLTQSALLNKHYGAFFKLRPALFCSSPL